MTEEIKNVSSLTLLLSVVAGYCDTATFVAGDGIFSAHVTGNFIVFSAQLLLGSQTGACLKLLTFPVFVVAVITGGWLIEKLPKHFSVLFLQSFLLLSAGTAAFLLTQTLNSLGTVTYVIVMMVVFAMGFQNAYGKRFSAETNGPTTMMTGNVTQASLDLGVWLRNHFRDAVSGQSLKKQMVSIGGFLAGCLFGALLGKWLGLASVFIPGAAMLLYCIFKEAN